MPSLQSLRRKIAAFKNTQKITKAMKMVAAAKLKRSQDRILAARPYAHKMRGVLGNLSQRVNRFAHPLLQKRDARRIEVVVVTSDRGLCGGFNGNIVRRAAEFLRQSEARGLEVTLSIVGRSPTAAVRRLAEDPRVQVTGRVDDVRPALHEAAVAVVPLRIGGGTRLKIFEAMAAGTPVVSTTIGAEGLPAVPGRHLLVADDPEGFARAVVTLLRSPEARRQMADAARSLVVEQFDWQAVSGHLDEAITGTSFLSGTPGAVRRAEEHPLKAS